MEQFMKIDDIDLHNLKVRKNNNHIIQFRTKYFYFFFYLFLFFFAGLIYVSSKMLFQNTNLALKYGNLLDEYNIPYEMGDTQFHNKIFIYSKQQKITLYIDKFLQSCIIILVEPTVAVEFFRVCHILRISKSNPTAFRYICYISV